MVFRPDCDETHSRYFVRLQTGGSSVINKRYCIKISVYQSEILRMLLPQFYKRENASKKKILMFLNEDFKKHMNTNVFTLCKSRHVCVPAPTRLNH